jgi:outer membrane protein assembly factor BamD (BamD/ComL family)
VKAGQMYASKKDFQKAADLFNKVCVQFSTDPKVVYALFFQALAYSDMAERNTNPADKQKNEARARSLFNDLIQKYPTHRLAKDSKSLVDMVGLSDEQMLEMAIKKHQADSIAQSKSPRVLSN